MTADIINMIYCHGHAADELKHDEAGAMRLA